MLVHETSDHQAWSAPSAMTSTQRTYQHSQYILGQCVSPLSKKLNLLVLMLQAVIISLDMGAPEKLHTNAWFVHSLCSTDCWIDLALGMSVGTSWTSYEPSPNNSGYHRWCWVQKNMLRVPRRCRVIGALGKTRPMVSHANASRVDSNYQWQIGLIINGLNIAWSTPIKISLILLSCILLVPSVHVGFRQEKIFRMTHRKLLSILAYDITCWLIFHTYTLLTNKHKYFEQCKCACIFKHRNSRLYLN